MQKVLLAIGLLFLGNAVYSSFSSTLNAGLVMLYCLALSLTAYGLWGKNIRTLTATGLPRILWLLFLAGCTVYMVLICFIAYSGLKREVQYNEAAIIVLGAGIRGEEPTPVLALRLDAAYEYHLQNPQALIVVSGGQGSNEIVPEALAMRQYLIKKGVDESLIIMEDASTSTLENFGFSKELLAQRGIEADAPIAFTSNNFHCYRAGEYAKMCGLENARSLPARTTSSALASCYLREVLAVVLLWIRMFLGTV